MADPQQREQQQQQLIQRPTDATRSILSEKGPSSSQVLAVVILLPIGGFLLFLAGITLTGTLIGLGISTPLFIIFSPILIPAALVIALAVSGFLTSGAFGITALSSLSCMANNLRRLRLPGQLEQAKGLVQETVGQVGQKTKEAGQSLQRKAQEGGRSDGGETHEGGGAHDVTIEEEDGKAEAQEGEKR